MGCSAVIDIEPTLRAAHDASVYAYAPYSAYHVGAAVLLDDGSIITGSNFENASYGLSLCAESVAIASANSQGRMKNIIAIAIAGGKPDKVDPNTAGTDKAGKAILSDKAAAPCGRCRQIIKEVADVTSRDTPIYCLHDGGYTRHTISEMLPDAFGPTNLA